MAATQYGQDALLTVAEMYEADAAASDAGELEARDAAFADWALNAAV